MIAEVDDSLFPIIILNTLPVEISDQQLEEYLLFHEKLLKEAREKLIIIYNTDNSRYLSGDQTVRISKWSKNNQPLFLEKTLGSCVVTSTILSNLIIRALRFLMKSNFDAEIFSNMDQALIWAKKLSNKK